MVAVGIGSKADLIADNAVPATDSLRVGLMVTEKPSRKGDLAMNYRQIAWASRGLWIAAVAVAAVLFVRGSTTSSSDGRRAILLSPVERDPVLGEMRAMLTRFKVSCRACTPTISSRPRPRRAPAAWQQRSISIRG
jgi:hypothetical protein